MAHDILFNNFAFSTLNGAITDSATSLAVQSSDGARFPGPTGAEFFRCVLEDAAGNLEIILVSTRAVDTFSVIVRAQEGTSARAWADGDKIRNIFSVQGILDLLADPHVDAATYNEQGSPPATPAAGEVVEFAQESGTGGGMYQKDDSGAISPLHWGITNMPDADTVLDQTVERWAAMAPSVSRDVTLPTTDIKDGRPIGIINKGPSTIVVKSSDATIILTIPSGLSIDFIAAVDTPTTPAQWHKFGSYLVSPTLATPVLLIPVIVDFTNAAHNHQDAAGGGVLPGGPPIGGIMAVVGTFTATGNGGSYSETGIVIGAGWKLCDGTVISDAESPFDGRFVPQLDDGRFLRGNTTAGTTGGSQTQNPFSDFAAAGNYTPLGTVDSHTHTLAHVHDFGEHALADRYALGKYDASTYGSPGSGRIRDGVVLQGSGAALNQYISDSEALGIMRTNSASVADTGGAAPGFTGTLVARNTFFLNSSVNVEPLYLNCKYYQRIK